MMCISLSKTLNPFFAIVPPRFLRCSARRAYPENSPTTSPTSTGRMLNYVKFDLMSVTPVIQLVRAIVERHTGVDEVLNGARNIHRLHVRRPIVLVDEK